MVAGRTADFSVEKGLFVTRKLQIEILSLLRSRKSLLAFGVRGGVVGPSTRASLGPQDRGRCCVRPRLVAMTREGGSRMRSPRFRFDSGDCKSSEAELMLQALELVEPGAQESRCGTNSVLPSYDAAWTRHAGACVDHRSGSVWKRLRGNGLTGAGGGVLQNDALSLASPPQDAFGRLLQNRAPFAGDDGAAVDDAVHGGFAFGDRRGATAARFRRNRILRIFCRPAFARPT